MKKVILMAALFCGSLATFAQEPCPQVIPALQQWKPAKGKMVLPESGKVIISSEGEGALKQSA